MSKTSATPKLKLNWGIKLHNLYREVSVYIVDVFDTIQTI